MPKYDFSLSLTSTKPLKQRDLEEFVVSALNNQQQRHSPDSDIANIEIKVLTAAVSEEIADITPDDQSGTVDSEDLEEGPDVDIGDEETPADDDIEGDEEEEEEEEDEGGATPTPPATDPFGK